LTAARQVPLRGKYRSAAGTLPRPSASPIKGPSGPLGPSGLLAFGLGLGGVWVWGGLAALRLFCVAGFWGSRASRRSFASRQAVQTNDEKPETTKSSSRRSSRRSALQLVIRTMQYHCFPLTLASTRTVTKRKTQIPKKSAPKPVLTNFDAI